MSQLTELGILGHVSSVGESLLTRLLMRRPLD